MTGLTRFRFDSALLPAGWRHDVVVGIDAEGTIASVAHDDRSTAATVVAGAALPGMPNAHSHAFQRAMAGLAERRASGRDSFWTWRETMYELAGRMTPQLLNAIAAQLYVEMLKAGYTSVCEFHYLHNQPSGAAYDDRALMSRALIDAASASGIGMTLLPTLYQAADFGGAAPTLRQRQFVLDTDAFLDLFDALRAGCQGPQACVGAALHSLRAVAASQLEVVLDALLARDCRVIHMHVAEQESEVQACIAHSGRRPIEWLLENAPVNARWCLVHATHATDAELHAVAASGAAVALCPTTEANLGDGVFALPRYLDAGGRIAIGSDSHIAVSAVEELRWLEYQQRLLQRQRNIFADVASGSTGAHLWRLACAGGAQACGRSVGALEVGRRADMVVLDLDAPALFGRTDESIVDTFVFSAQPNPIRDVMVGGRWLVQQGRHFAETTIAAGYKRALRTLQ